VTLGQLCERSNLGRTRAGEAGDTLVTGVVCDSRVVKIGDLFVAVQGQHFDGAAFVTEARARGAVAVVAEDVQPPCFDVPWIQVDDARATMAVLAAAFYGHPSHELLVVGTTGTNGKTTTTYLIEAILQAAGIACGRVSSVSYRIGDDEQSAERTTPESPHLQAMMRKMVDAGCRACVMEVSSHALDLRRADAIRFDVAVFTNLTRDHLDFHGDMSRYFAAKRRLFDMLADTSPAVINVDDPYGRELALAVVKSVTYAIDAVADVKPERFDLSLSGMELDVRTSRGLLRLRSSLLGRINAYNVLAAAATGVSLALSLRAIEEGVGEVERVPGRMEVVSSAVDDVSVLVDFAHTDDALKGLLETLRPLARGRLITVFGCGGDRDTTKRSLMGTVAGRLSDLVVLTSDNPRSEDPMVIVKDIELGLTGGDTPWSTVLDREEAMIRAICEARPGDLVVVAGKGHERYQVIGARSLPFEDVAVARSALAYRRSCSRVG
jgi:UDP-N-acetylmuramoyl-L-alanyl-D-glutamate--2,6-diaminopimelate ligase